MTIRRQTIGGDGKPVAGGQSMGTLRGDPSAACTYTADANPVSHKKTFRGIRFRPIAFLLLISLFLFVTAQNTLAADLKPFFSEYIEGSSNNKALEIYNPTDAAINVSGYDVQIFSNGSPTASSTIALTGSIPARGVFVLAHTSANATILSKANQTSGSVSYNGNDAVLLRQGTTVLDRIGQVGFDPGTRWGTSPTSTMDNTLVRNPGISAGDTNSSAVFVPAAQWTGYAVDTFTYLGAHDITTYSVTYAPGTQGTFGAQTNLNRIIGSDTPAAPAVTGNAGWTFAGWSPTPSATVTSTVTYTAQWTQNVYTVRYEPGNHGTFFPEETTGLENGAVTPPLMAEITGQQHWTFSGWDPVLSPTVTSSVTYIAQWTQNEYTVTYNPGTRGDFNPQITTNLHAGDPMPAGPAAPGYPGWTFTGWDPVPTATVTGDATYDAQWAQDTYTVGYAPGLYGTFDPEATGGLHYDDDTPALVAAITGQPDWAFAGWSPVWAAKVTSSVIYIAQWTQTEYTVTYAPGDHGDFTAQITTGLHAGDPTPTAPATPGDPGWTFAGWDSTPSMTVTGNTIYTAQWTQDEYTVGYDPGIYGTFVPESTGGLHYSDATPSLSVPATGQEHWTFTGWDPTWSATVTGSVTYTAQWEKELYSLPQGPVVFYHVYGGGGNINGIYSNDFVVLKNISAVPVNLDGWMIKYAAYAGTVWTTTGPLSGYICPGAYYVVKAFEGANAASQTALPYFHVSLPLLAIHQKEYKIQLLNQNLQVVDFIGSGLANEYLGSGAAPLTADSGTNRNRQSLIRTSYSGNNNLDYIVQSPTDLSYLQTDQIYTVAFDGNTGDTGPAPASMTVRHGNTVNVLPSEPTKAHSTFAGWNTASDGTGTAFDQTTPVMSCLRVYAMWTRDEFSVTYNPGDYGTFDPQISTGLHYGDPTPDEPVITGQPGWTFTWWTPSKAAMVIDNTTYTAQWRWDGIPVIFLPGAHGSFDPTGAPSLQRIEYGAAAQAPTVIEDMGYIFTGWDVAFTHVTDNLIVTAQYSIKTVTVSFDARDGSAIGKIITGEGTIIIPPADPTHTGFMFIGWYKDSSLTTLWDFAVDIVMADMTLYARWTPVTLSGLPDSYTMHVGDKVSWAPNPPDGQWTWDISYFSATSGTPRTFTALSKGNTTVVYTAYGVQHSIYVTILPRSGLPDTGEHGMDNRITGVLALILGGALIFLAIKKKRV